MNEIKVNGSSSPVTFSGLHSGCVSFKYGHPLCWGTLRILLKMLNIGMCDVRCNGFYVNLRGIWWGVGNWDQNKRHGNGDIEVDYNRKQGWCWVSQDQNYWVGFEEGVRISLRKKEEIYESRENICMCLYLEINYLENKNGRGWVQLGEGVLG